MTRVSPGKVSTRATRRPELEAAVRLAGERQGSHHPSGIVFTVLAAVSGKEREYIRDRTLEGHDSARKRGKAIGGAGVTDESIAARVSGPRPAPGAPTAQPTGRWAGSV